MKEGNPLTMALGSKTRERIQAAMDAPRQAIILGVLAFLTSLAALLVALIGGPKVKG